MDFIFDRTDDQEILDHASWSFDYYPNDHYDDLLDFYQDWLTYQSMPDLNNYLIKDT